MTEVEVCHINVARGYRGGERQTELLIRELAQRGVPQALVCRRSEPLSQRLRDVAVEIREVSGNPLRSALACGRAALVHVHEGRSVYAAWLRRSFGGSPYVITRRVDNPIREHSFAHKTYTSAATVAAVATQVADIVRAYDPEINVAVVHSGSSGLSVDRAISTRLRSQWPGKFLVGHVGALDNSQKGQEYIFAVARRMAASHPDIQFVLVGGGKDEALLRGMAGGLPNVTFTGFVDNVGDYLSIFDLFILPSNREGVGSILFDAMEQQLPVVASAVGGVPDIVHDHVNGLLIDAASPEQLFDAIVKLRGDAGLRHRLGSAGQEFARAYTASVMCEKYLRIYADALGRPVVRASTESQ